MTTKLILGEEVVVTGRYVEADITVASDQFNKIRITERYELKRFEEARRGFVVGTRSIVKNLIHKFRGDSDLEYPEGYLEDYDNWITDIHKRETVYLVACDMRGLMYVPETEVIPKDLLGEACYGLENIEGWTREEVDRFFSRV